MSALPLPMPGLLVGPVPTNHSVGPVPTNHSVGPVPINHNSIAPISNKRVPNSYAPVTDRSVSRAAARPTTTPGDWHLTHRGIAVIMVVAAMILTTALVVLGLTVVRVTGTDYGADLQEPGQAQR